MTKKTSKNSASKATAPKKGKVRNKTKGSAAASSPKKKLQSLEYLDGKKTVEQIEELEKLVGIKEVNYYGTTSLEVLEARLAEMNMWEIQEFAVKAGVFPSGTRTSLKSKITKEFLAYNRGKGRHIALPSPTQVGSHLTKEQLDKVLELTKKGL